jgi:hypothetical protein
MQDQSAIIDYSLKQGIKRSIINHKLLLNGFQFN